MADPLRETLFRAAGFAPDPPAQLSPDPLAGFTPDPPAGIEGTRIRAGNAMTRSRSAILDGARRCVEVSGTKITMSQVAAAAGVAKATLYNHFRTKDEVLGALLVDEVQRLIAAVSSAPLPDALARSAATLSDHPRLRALAGEPATLCALAVVDSESAGWGLACEAVDTALRGARRAGAAHVIRWLASFLTNPAEPADIADDVALLIAALPDRRAAADAAQEVHTA